MVVPKIKPLYVIDKYTRTHTVMIKFNVRRELMELELKRVK